MNPFLNTGGSDDAFRPSPATDAKPGDVVSQGDPQSQAAPYEQRQALYGQAVFFVDLTATGGGGGGGEDPPGMRPGGEDPPGVRPQAPKKPRGTYGKAGHQAVLQPITEPAEAFELDYTDPGGRAAVTIRSRSDGIIAPASQLPTSTYTGIGTDQVDLALVDLADVTPDSSQGEFLYTDTTSLGPQLPLPLFARGLPADKKVEEEDWSPEVEWDQATDLFGELMPPMFSALAPVYDTQAESYDASDESAPAFDRESKWEVVFRKVKFKITKDLGLEFFDPATILAAIMQIEGAIETRVDLEPWLVYKWALGEFDYHKRSRKKLEDGSYIYFDERWSGERCVFCIFWGVFFIAKGDAEAGRFNVKQIEEMGLASLLDEPQRVLSEYVRGILDGEKMGAIANDPKKLQAGAAIQRKIAAMEANKNIPNATVNSIKYKYKYTKVKLEEPR